MTLDTAPDIVIAHWAEPADWSQHRIGTGLINDTFLLSGPGDGKLVLQRLHTIFAPEVNEDIDAVTRHLAAHGMVTPRLVLTRNGATSIIHENRTWRVLSFVPGHSIDFVDSPARARAAGALVGRFHAVLDGFDYQYRSIRPGVHDTPLHLQNLAATLMEKHDHRLYDATAPLAEDLLRQAELLRDLSDLPERHSHGDLKISNLIFDSSGEAVCLIDLDTLTRMRWPLEMGDALRSWCNPGREDQRPGKLDLDLLTAALEGYAGTTPGLLKREETGALTDGLIQICLELACRFAADALNENYFGWDPTRYAGRGEHNLARAGAMSDLLRDVREQEAGIRRLTLSLAG